MWTSKYAGELVGIDSQFDAMSEWLAALERGDRECKPVMILAGPTGSGKTVSAHKLLTQRGYRVIERHGADHRTKTAFENDILQTVRSSWNGMIRQGVLMEDIDSITVTTNNCGLDVLIRIASALTTADGVPREVTPVICTMDDVQSRGKLNDLVKKCHVVIFGKVCSEALQELGRRMLQKEGAICSEDRLLDLTRTASGDARWLVNALELEQGGSGQLQPRKVALAAAADRKQLEEKEAVRRMLYASKEPHEEGHLARLELLCSGQEPFTITSLVQENYVIACGEDTDAAARLADMSSHVIWWIRTSTALRTGPSWRRFRTWGCFPWRSLWPPPRRLRHHSHQHSVR
jgi:DNA polymerase III delta prime subunit